MYATYATTQLLAWRLLLLLATLSNRSWSAAKTVKSVNSDIRFGDEHSKFCIYRLVGNEFQDIYTHRKYISSIKFIVKNEAEFHGVTKRWILHRIWNATEFKLLYAELVMAGVNRRDIIADCDFTTYTDLHSWSMKFDFFTSTNAGYNLGISDGRDSGFDWTILLDGHDFILTGSWQMIQAALDAATESKKMYMKIPIHHLQNSIDPTWLSPQTAVEKAVHHTLYIDFSLAFHKTALDVFADDSISRPNVKKSILSFDVAIRDNTVCGPKSKVCQCASATGLLASSSSLSPAGMGSISWRDSENCGFVIDLSTYDYEGSGDLMTIQPCKNDGFFNFVKSHAHSFKYDSECELLTKAMAKWIYSSETDKTDANSQRKKTFEAKAELYPIFSNASCVAERNLYLSAQAVRMMDTNFNPDDEYCSLLR